MKWQNSMISIIGTFVAGTLLLVIYLLSIRWHIYLPMFVFWLAIVIILGTVIYQTLFHQLSANYAKVVLFEIVVTGLVLHLIYLIPYYGLRGSDDYIDMASVKGILSSGFVMGNPSYINVTSSFPMLHVLSAQLSLILNIDPLSVAKWFPSFLDISLSFFQYLIVRRIFRKERIALLSTLLFACMQNHILFGSDFVRQTIALVFSASCIYFYFLAENSSHITTYHVLSMVFLIATILSHHLTSLMLSLFLSVDVMIRWTSELSFFRRIYFGDNVTGEKIDILFFPIAFIASFAYWLYVIDLSPFQILVSFIKDIFNTKLWGVETYSQVGTIPYTAIVTIRGYIIYYGFYFFMLIFGAILVYQLLSKRRSHKLEMYSFTIFLFFCGLMGLLSLYLISARVYPDRFLSYGWLFGFAPLVLAIITGRNKWFQRFGVFLLISFMIFNIYQIETTAWDAKSEGVSVAPSAEEYSFAKIFDFSKGRILAHASVAMAIYDVYNNQSTLVYDWVSVDEDLTTFDWVIVNKKALILELKLYGQQVKGAEAEIIKLTKGDSPGKNKVYESNTLVSFIRATS